MGGHVYGPVIVDMSGTEGIEKTVSRAAELHAHNRQAPLFPQPVRFNFQLGAWRFLTLSRQLVVLESDRDCTPFMDVIKSEQSQNGTDGYLLKGLPAPPDPSIGQLAPHWDVRTFRRYPRHLIDLTIGFDAYLAKFSGKTRSTIKRKIRRFEELSPGDTVWREFRTPVELDEFFPLAREVSAKTYQERLLNAGLPTSDTFKKEALERARHGLVRAYILYVRGHAISYLYLPIENGRAVYAYLGYDPAYAEHSPGTVLQMLALKCLFDDPDLKVFDFTEGEGQHKQLFSTSTQNCEDVLILKRGSKTAWIAMLHAGFSTAETWLAKCIERLGLKRSVKLLVRRLAQGKM